MNQSPLIITTDSPSVLASVLHNGAPLKGLHRRGGRATRVREVVKIHLDEESVGSILWFGICDPEICSALLAVGKRGGGTKRLTSLRPVSWLCPPDPISPKRSMTVEYLSHPPIMIHVPMRPERHEREYKR